MINHIDKLKELIKPEIFKISLNIDDNCMRFSFSSNQQYNESIVRYVSECLNSLYSLDSAKYIEWCPSSGYFIVEIPDTNLLEDVLKRSKIEHEYIDRRLIINRRKRSYFRFTLTSIDDVISILVTIINYGNRKNKISNILHRNVKEIL